jgi:hypothetical protein
VAAGTSRSEGVMYVTCDDPPRTAAARTRSSSSPRANGAGDSVVWTMAEIVAIAAAH